MAGFYALERALEVIACSHVGDDTIEGALPPSGDRTPSPERLAAIFPLIFGGASVGKEAPSPRGARRSARRPRTPVAAARLRRLAEAPQAPRSLLDRGLTAEGAPLDEGLEGLRGGAGGDGADPRKQTWPQHAGDDPASSGADAASGCTGSVSSCATTLACPREPLRRRHPVLLSGGFLRRKCAERRPRTDGERGPCEPRMMAGHTSADVSSALANPGAGPAAGAAKGAAAGAAAAALAAGVPPWPSEEARGAVPTAAAGRAGRALCVECLDGTSISPGCLVTVRAASGGRAQEEFCRARVLTVDTARASCKVRMRDGSIQTVCAGQVKRLVLKLRYAIDSDLS